MASYQADCSICGNRYGSSDRVEAEKRICYTCTRPGMARACAECGKAFKAHHADTRICHSCWYRANIEAAETRFAPLAAALERAGLPPGSVLQSGGMVMLWKVPIEREVDTPGDDTRYLCFSDPQDSCDGWKNGLPLAFCYFWRVYDADANAGLDEQWCAVEITGATLDDCAAKTVGWLAAHGLRAAHDPTLENEGTYKCQGT